jgi:phosphoglycolate phosphatase
MKDKYILFDFDGVIIDSFACAYAVKKMICPNATESQYRKCFDGNINDDWHKGDIEHDETCRHGLDFSVEYSPLIEKDAPIFPGMREVIRKLARSYKLIIISSTLTAPIGAILNKFGIASFFTDVFGNDVNPSKVEKIKLVFSKYSIAAEQCVFVTDTLGDMLEASKTGVKAIGVAWGFQDKATLLRGKPFKIAKKPTDLAPIVFDHFFRPNLAKARPAEPLTVDLFDPGLEERIKNTGSVYDRLIKPLKKAEPAKERTEVKTDLKGRFVETQAEAEPDDWIVTGPEGEKFVLSHKKFHDRYRSDGKGGYLPKERRIVALKNPFKKTIRIAAPWGSAGKPAYEFGDENCFLAVSLDKNGEFTRDRYLIGDGEILLSNYRPARP